MVSPGGPDFSEVSVAPGCRSPKKFDRFRQLSPAVSVRGLVLDDDPVGMRVPCLLNMERWNPRAFSDENGR